MSAAALLGAASPAMAGGTITTGLTFDFTATAGETNNLTVSYVSGTTSYVVTDNGGAVFSPVQVPGCALSNGNRTATCSAPLATEVTIGLGNLDDTISFGTMTGASPVTVDGGDGEDDLNGSAAGDILVGGAGDDDLDGKLGDDSLAGGTGADALKGGDGIDTATYAAAAGAVTATLDNQPNDGAGCPATCENDNVGPAGDVENVTGGAGNDSLSGNGVGNTLSGGAGNDVLDGGLGTDTLDGGANTDTASWASRTDQAIAADLVDTDASPGDGATGENDTLTAIESLTGGSLGDTLTGDTVANTLTGGPGDDTLTSSDGADTLAGGDGTDTLDAGTGTDALTGGDGSDTLNAGTGTDTLDGGPGADSLAGGADTVQDILTGGTGTDTVSYVDRTAPDAVGTRLNITLDGVANDGVPGETDNVGGPDNSVENVIGGVANDIIVGNAAANAFNGGDGDDSLYGQAGVDVLDGDAGQDALEGGDGADTLDGDTGNDTASYADHATGVTVTLKSGTTDDGNSADGPAGARDDAQTEHVTGGAGNDTLIGDDLANDLNGGDGDDLLDGKLGADKLDGANGDDTATYATRATAITVTIDGAADDGAAEGDNVGLTTENVIGGTGVNNLTGSPSANRLVGGPVSDTFDGGGGNDVFEGGPGIVADTFDGSTGSDTVTYADRSAPVSVTLGDATANDGEATENDSLASIERAIGGSGGDTLTGSTSVNVLTGGLGDDTLDGGSGALVADTLDGGGGSDTASYANRTDNLSLTLDSTANDGALAENDTLTAVENLTGGSGDDTITGDALVNDLKGGLGVDTMTSRDSVADTVSCGGGIDATVVADLNDDIDADCETVDPGPVPALTIGDVTKAEGDSGTSNAVVTVTATPAPTAPISVDFATADGTATQPSDYTTASGTLNFAVGETTKTIDVPVKGDALVEADETVTVGLSDATNATLPAGPATVTITNDDAPVLSIASGQVAEGNSGTATLKLTVTADKPSVTPVTVKATTTNGTATAPGDYTALTNQIITIPIGETTADVDITVNGDTTVEANETFTVTLTDPTGATIAGGGDQATGTITNDDTFPVASIADVTRGEGSTPATFTVTLSKTYPESVSVNYATTNGTATTPGDYTTASGTVTIPSGETTGTFTVALVDDTLDEADETFTATLSSPTNATIGDGSATGTITDNDAAPVLSIAAGQVAEGNSGTATLKLIVTADKPAVGPMTVKATTTDGTATAGSDYTALAAQVITIPAGQTTGEVEVSVTGDAVDEPDETLTATLSDPTAATIASGGGTATGTILDDDAAPPPVVPAISIGDATVTEGNSATVTSTFAVTLDKATTVPVTVTVATSDNTAKAPADYTPTTGTLTFTPGETSKSVAVLVKGDLVDEPNETFGVLLGTATNATLAAKAVGVGTILDDDAPTVPALVRPKLGAKVSPTRDRTAPFTYTVSGKLVLPAGTTAPTACTAGTVTVTFKVGSKTVKTAKGALSSTCTYRIRATFKSAKDLKAVKGKKFTARARFGGNTRLLPAAQTFTLRAG